MEYKRADYNLEN